MKNKTVILCEKPDMAKNIAAAFGNYQSHQGYVENDKYIITWAFGHIVSLKSPNTYINNERIEKQDLPIIPNPFQLEVIADKRKQYKKIKELFNNTNHIINATDAGREGELIFRYIYTLCGQNKPFDRLWLKSLTKKGVLNAFENIVDGHTKDDLYWAAKARSEADWLVGLNCSIAFTYQANIGTTLSLGRVQTPTLNMIVERFLQIQNFKPTPIFSPSIVIEEQNTNIIAVYQQKFEEAPQPNPLDKINSKVFCILNTKKERKEKAPLPYDLPTLQQVASKEFKYPAKKTADLMQALYEKHKVLTYLRTDSRYLTEDLFEQVPNIMKLMHPFSEKSADITNTILSSSLPKYCVNDDKVTDHHAIIPTGVLPENLSYDEKCIFQLVYIQFLAAFLPPCVKEITYYGFASSQEEHILDTKDFYSVTGTVVKTIGWRICDTKSSKDSILPRIDIGQIVTVIDKKMNQGTTKPKTLFTDGTLIGVMNGCGKEFDANYDIPNDVKNNGIGRQGTRDQIIETLLIRNYISRDKNFLIPTKIGMQTIKCIKDSPLTSVSLTGQWENSLERISQGKLKYTDFMESIYEFTTELTTYLKELKIDFEIEKHSCPKCNNESLINKKSLFECVTNSCDFKLWKKIGGKVLSENVLLTLLEKGKTSIIKGFVSNKNPDKPMKFEAILEIKEGKLGFVFPTHNTLSKTYSCPKCNKGTIKENAKSFYCSEFKNDCTFSIWKTMFSKKLNTKYIELLLCQKRTPMINGFKSGKGKLFNAAIEFNKEFKTTLIFK